MVTLETLQVFFTERGSCITHSRQQQSQTLFQDCPEAQNKRATLRVRTRKKRKTLSNFCDFLQQIASKDLDTALTVKTPEKMGFYSGPRRPIGTQSLWSSICRIIMRTKRHFFWWKKVGGMFVDGNLCFFPANIAHFFRSTWTITDVG